MTGSTPEGGGLHDVHLWRALEHAPDQGVAPDWRLRKAILKQARDAVGELDPDDAEAALEEAAQSWWQQLAVGGTGRRKSWRPWQAGLAALLVAALALVLWRRGPDLEPYPGDEVQRVAASQDLEPAPAPSGEMVGPPRDPASIPLLPPSFFALPELPPADAPAEPAPVAPPPAPAPKAQGAPRMAAPPSPPNPLPAATPPAVRGDHPKPAGADAAVTAAAAPRPAAPPVAPAPAAVPAPPAPPPSPPARTDTSEPPTFDALLQWNRITISRRGGESRSLPRAEAREVSALLGSAALSADAPQPLKGTPEWRVTLERGAEVLAVFELAGPQVRWREGHAPAATGTPSAGSVSALREALNSAVQAQAQETPGPRPGPSPAEPPRAP